MGAASKSLDSEILESSRTAFIDRLHESSIDHRTQLVTNNYHRGKKVLAAIEHELGQCKSFDFCVAFITMSGITPLLQTFAELRERDIRGRILTTDYLSFSEPRALQKLSEFENIDVRMLLTGNRDHGFHPKGYLFEREDNSFRIIVGSSNLTHSALSTNKEWNAKLAAMPKGEILEEIQLEFLEMWKKAEPISDILETYRAIYEEKKQAIAKSNLVSIEQIRLEPNAMQAQFVNNLSELVSDGESRALLISATGTGKTYASAFALRHLDPQRVLFLAHREQVLNQSIQSFIKVFGKTKSFGLLSGNSAQYNADYLFATMQTMSKQSVLEKFRPDEFSYIVIDEVHRAGAKSYQIILNYFNADFYLGMTASPDRPDGFDIYGLFDNNIAYEIRLQQALEEELLCPFHYFGITDLIVDGREIDDSSSLKDFSFLVSDDRVSHIIEKAKYYGFSGERVRGLVFCSRKDEARELSEKFNLLGYQTICLTGDNSQEQRGEAIDRLSNSSPQREDQLDYIFTVDVFNEGIDIPNANQIIMLRPTESPIVFVQQLGRGLRRADNKDYVVILDFIGNYSNNYMIPLALSGDRSYNKDIIRKYVMEGSRVIPGASSVHFDQISRNRIYQSIDVAGVTLRILKDKYLVLKQKLGHIPKLTDYWDHSEVDPLLFIDKKGSYHNFLKYAEPEYLVEFTNTEVLVLEYVSRFIANGMRPHELIMLKEILFNGEVSAENVGKELAEYYYTNLSDEEFESSKRILNKEFLNSAGDKKKFDTVALVDTSPGSRIIKGSMQLQEMLKSSDFKDALLDIIGFGLQRGQDKYTGAGSNLKLYEKYTRKDVCRLLNWEKDDSSTIYGYRVKHGTCPIFVTYNKEDSISSSTRYDDAFIDPRTFSWMTRSRLTLNSPEVRQIVDSETLGINLHLFVKLSDDEGSDFYYMGKARPVDQRQTTIQDDNGRTLSIVNFTLRLETSVRDDLYEYLTA